MNIKKLNEELNKILEDTESIFPPGSFAEWFGEDLTSQTYEGSIYCMNENLTSLYGCPSIVTGSFDCPGNQLTSLEYAPQEVGESFNCVYNKLTSLKGAPQKVGGYFNCEHNELTSLQYAPQEVGEDFQCHCNQLTSLEYAPQKVGGVFNCSYNELTSLEGAPKYVGESFFCFNNNLTSLVGAPQEVGGWFDCSYNNLTSLEGAPQKVGGHFDCCDNKLISLKGGPQEVGRDFDCRYNSDLTSLEGAPQHVGGNIYSDFNTPENISNTSFSNEVQSLEDEYSDEQDSDEEGLYIQDGGKICLCVQQKIDKVKEFLDTLPENPQKDDKWVNDLIQYLNKNKIKYSYITDEFEWNLDGEYDSISQLLQNYKKDLEENNHKNIEITTEEYNEIDFNEDNNCLLIPIMWVTVSASYVER